MGQTGVGKSTFCRALIQGAKTIDYDEEEQVVPKGDDLIYNGRKIFETSTGVESCTTTPGFFKMKNGVYIVDCPGLDDNDPTKEYPNMTAIKYILSIAKSYRLMILVSKEQLEVQRAAPFVMGLSKITAFLTDDGIKSAGDFTLMVMCKGTFMKSADNYLEGKKTKLD